MVRPSRKCGPGEDVGRILRMFGEQAGTPMPTTGSVVVGLSGSVFSSLVPRSRIES
ncbi:hypothetical protein G3I20_21815 [Streptomyces sp. SID8111]|uniref:hypothetical protein n=1 Tax=unclassified Streptomyces TaxID=2593676 RepID=UPI0013C1EBE3|nr:hypothetical protein [Streptomyces sp. SID8111]NEC26159.1 hypothetical protein [Streptomyces sp. SID8111]NEC29146.1 hypothetical protein [Streptomyces sp. SID8111]